MALTEDNDDWDLLTHVRQRHHYRRPKFAVRERERKRERERGRKRERESERERKRGRE